MSAALTRMDDRNAILKKSVKQAKSGEVLGKGPGNFTYGLKLRTLQSLYSIDLVLSRNNKKVVKIVWNTAGNPTTNL